MENKLTNLVDYIILAILIIISGAVIYQQYNQQFLIGSLIFFLIIFFVRNKNVHFSKKNIFILLLLLIFMCIDYLININDNDLSKYISYVIRFIISITVIRTISFDNFREKYCNLIIILSISSLFFYLIGIFNYNFPYKFPVIKDFSGYDFTNAILYVYRIPMINGYRNNSIFWEAGAFQAIVNLALFFTLFFSKSKIKFKIMVYIIAIISTFSTTGYILLFLNLGIYIIRKKINIGKIYLIIIVSCIVLFSSVGSVIFNKFDSNNLSYSRRNIDVKVDIDIAFDNILNLTFGHGPNKYLERFPQQIELYGMTGSSSSNGITGTLAQFGLIFLVILFYFYFSNLNYITKNKLYKLLIIIVFCLIFSSENFMFSPLFLTIAAYKNDFNYKI